MSVTGNRPFFFLPLDVATNVSDLPHKLDYPFYYDPKPLAIYAAKQLQGLLEKEEFNHNFGIGQKERGNAIGKMFGVLVVENSSDEIGYLAAFPGN